MRPLLLTFAIAAVGCPTATGQVEPPYRMPDRVRGYYGPPRQDEPAPSQLAFSADGRRLYAIVGQGFEDLEIGGLPRLRAYDLASGRVVHQLVPSGDRLIRSDGTPAPRPSRERPNVRYRAMTFLPGADTVVAHNSKRGLMVVDPESGDRVRADQGSVTWMKPSFSAGGRRVLENRAANGLRILDADTGRQYWIAQSKKDADLPAALSPDGRVVAVARAAGTVDLVEVEQVSRRRTVSLTEPQPVRPLALAFSPDGRLLAVATRGGVTFVSLDDERVTGSLPATRSSDDARLIFSRDGQRLAVVAGSRVDVIEVSTLRLLFRHDSPSGPVGPVALSADGLALACPAPGFGFRVWDFESGAERHRPAGHGKGLVTALGTADGKRVITLGREPGLCVWEAGTGHFLTRGLDSAFEAAGPAALAPDGRALVALEADGRVSWFEVEGGQRVRSEPRLRGAAVLALSADGRTLLAAAGAETVALDVASGRERWSAAGHANGGLCAVEMPNGASFVLGSGGGSLRRRDARTGEDLWHVTAGLGPIVQLAASAKGARVAAGNANGQLFVVSAGDGHREEVVETGRGPIGPLAFSEDGRFLAYAKNSVERPDWPIVVRELATGTAVAKIRDHPGPALALWFSPEGRNLYTATAYAALRWEWLPGSDQDVADTDDLVLAWYMLADNDGGFAEAAMGRLVGHPEAALRAFPDAQLPEAEALTPRIRRLVERLDHPRFPVRERTSQQLAQIGVWAEGELQRLVRKPPSEEAGRRAEQLLRRIGEPGARWAEVGLRRLRTCVALDRMGTPEARALLRGLADSWPEAKAYLNQPTPMPPADRLDVLTAVRLRPDPPRNRQP